MLEQKHSFNFRGEKIVVSFPNVGQIIDMESLKQALTSNRYSSMSASGMKSMYFALDLVDSIVFFQVMCPRIKGIAEIKDYTSIDTTLAKELIDTYKEEIFKPWYKLVLAELYSYDKPEEADTEK